MITDLTKMTAAELMSIGPWPDAKAEIRQRLERLDELEQPDDALLRIGAPAVPFLEQVEWMRKRLAALEAAARPFVEYWQRCDEADAYPWALTPEDWKRLAKALER